MSNVFIITVGLNICSELFNIDLSTLVLIVNQQSEETTKKVQTTRND